MKLAVIMKINLELDKAVEKGDLQTFVSLINQHKVDVNSFLFGQMPALHSACRKGLKEFVQWLLDQPQTELEKQDGFGSRAIHHTVVVHNSYEILEILIKKGAQLDCRVGSSDDGNTPLYLALWSRNLECCRLLIQYGCNINLQHGSLMETPLHCASLSGIHPEIVKLLVAKLMEEQADHPEKLIDAKRLDGRTALLLACQKKNCAAIELLVEAGADIMAVDNEGNTALILVASSPDEDQIPTRELSPILYELNQRKTNKKLFESHPILLIFAYLIKKGCCWEATNKTGQKASDILLERGHSQYIIDLLGRTAAQRKRGSSSQSDGGDPPENDGINQSESSEKNDVSLKLIDDGSEQGFVEDRFGNKFICIGRPGKGGSIGYRCGKMKDSSRYVRCSGYARRIVVDGVSSIELETKHNHGPLGGGKRRRRNAGGAT